MILDLENRVALVTGCLGGIGSEICKLLAEAGATVIGVDLPEQSGHWPEYYPELCSYRQLDVTDEAAWNTLATSVAKDYGALDILVHNAGVAVIDKVEDMKIEAWRKQMAVNADGPFLGTKAFMMLMNETGMKRPFGTSIVMISSVAGLVGTPFSAGYSATKGAVRLFTKSAAVEFSALRYKIRVNSVHPGVVETGMIEEIRERYVEVGISSSVEEAARRTPKAMGRTANPNDIAKAVRFLASDEAGYMNGSEVVVDGGFTAN